VRHASGRLVCRNLAASAKIVGFRESGSEYRAFHPPRPRPDSSLNSHQYLYRLPLTVLEVELGACATTACNRQSRGSEDEEAGNPVVRNGRVVRPTRGKLGRRLTAVV
jgi:hypothetical protein